MTRQEFEVWASAHGWTKDQWGHYHKGDRRFKLSKVPALTIPETSVLAHGSLDYADDHRRQRDVVINREQPASADAWRMIHGEVLTFTEPERLARLDQLEGFHPPGLCLYRRVLAPGLDHPGTRWGGRCVITKAQPTDILSTPTSASPTPARFAPKGTCQLLMHACG